MTSPGGSAPPPVWLTARGPVRLDRPVLVGILNVTPDSFSDGGRYGAAAAALAHTESLLAAGADIIDIGGESTRPGRFETVPADEELRRVLPAIETILRALQRLTQKIEPGDSQRGQEEPGADENGDG